MDTQQRAIWLLAVLILLCGALGACGWGPASDQAPGPSPAPTATLPVQRAPATPASAASRTETSPAPTATLPDERVQATPASAASRTETSPAPTATLPDERASATPVTAPQVPKIAAGLTGLAFDAFLERSYNQLLLRDPELLTQLGLADAFGVGNDRLTDISDAYIRETQALEAAILRILQGYDRATLDPAQQLSADIYGWWLEDRVRGHRWMYHTYPVSQFITAVHQDLIQFFTDIHPVTNRQDAEDYVTRLSQVDTKLDQLIDGLERREELGIVPPRFIVQWALRDLKGIAGASPHSLPFYTAFADKVRALPGMAEADKQALLDAAAWEVEATVIPAFRRLVETMEHLETVATNKDGVWKLPDGEAFYAYALRHHTTTALTADDIHELGLQEMERIQAEMRAVFDALGYPTDEGLPALMNRVAQDGGILYGEEILAEYEALIQEASENVSAAFDLRPQADVVVIGSPIGGYYVAPALDGSRPGAFYATMTGSETRFRMPSLAYHEAIPGHHFQIAIAQELDLPSARKGVRFTAYSEGWALYAERLAYELGFYDDDPYGNIGRLQYELWRAVRLVVDTGLHARRWTFDQAVDYMVENTGLPRERVQWEVARYIVWPGQSTSYEIGMLRFLDVRQNAMDALGEQFDLTAFHNRVLGHGSVPLEILERIVDDYVAPKKIP
jgi:uncharacterized protein (DUF885 family)